MSKTVYLIDYENVHEAGLQGMNLCPAGDSIHLFYSVNANRLSLDLLRGMQATLTVHKVQPGRQSLDMQLVSYLGYLIGTEGPDCHFVIVSKDTDFTNTPLFWKDEMGIEVLRRQTIDGSEITPAPAARSRSGRGRGGNRRNDRDSHPAPSVKATEAEAPASIPFPVPETLPADTGVPLPGPVEVDSLSAAFPEASSLTPSVPDTAAEAHSVPIPEPSVSKEKATPTEKSEPLDPIAAEALRYATIASPAREFGGPSQPTSGSRPTKAPKPPFVPVPAREVGVAKPKVEEATVATESTPPSEPEITPAAALEAAPVPEAAAVTPAEEAYSPTLGSGNDTPTEAAAEEAAAAEPPAKPAAKARGNRSRRRKAPAPESPASRESAAPATSESTPTVVPSLDPQETAAESESVIKEQAPAKTGRKKATTSKAAIDKEAEAPKAPKGKKPSGAPDKKTQLNNALMKVLSDKKVDNDTTMKILGIAMPLFGDTAIKQLTYRGMVKEFGQKKGLELYNIIKPLWNEKKK
ncbi:MAG: PIN domain-containing protein [Oscillospiraceae bacterium]|nr:PIN domain-containing protein [Oscillospiraceae bacterium]